MSRKRPNWKNIGLAVLSLTLMVFAIVSIVKTVGKEERETCSKIVVSVMDSGDLRFVTATEVEKLIIAKYPKIIGMPDKAIDTKKIETLLKKDPVIKKAECYFLPSGDLGVKVWQRHPVMRLFGDENCYVDSEGKKFPLSNNYIAYVPIVTGTVNKDMLGGKLTDFMTYISKDEFWSAEIQQVDVAQDGNIKIVPTFGDHIIEFGNIENYDRKLKKLKTFYVNGLNKIGWGDYKTVNVEYDKQVVCTKEE